VSKFPRIINVNKIAIRAKDQPTGGTTITADCTATTFVMLEQGGAKPGAPAAAGARPAPRSN
jgi:hypothetical protein